MSDPGPNIKFMFDTIQPDADSGFAVPVPVPMVSGPGTTVPVPAPGTTVPVPAPGTTGPGRDSSHAGAAVPAQPPDPDPPDPVPLERLEAQICELAGHLTAATCRFLVLLADFDARRGWASWEMNSCAQWLSWKCQMSSGAAREHVRVARALRDLPVIRAEFAAARLSYAKVRALTRIATPDTEQGLAEIAGPMTGNQLERFAAPTGRSATLTTPRPGSGGGWPGGSRTTGPSRAPSGSRRYRGRCCCRPCGPPPGTWTTRTTPRTAAGTAFPRKRRPEISHAWRHHRAWLIHSW